MKVQVTQKQMRENYRVYMVGDCNPLERILSRYFTANYYNAGVYGWNADIYTLGGVAFVRGYRPFGKMMPKEVEKKFARRIKFLFSTDYSRQNIKKAEKLLRDIANDLYNYEY